MIRHTPIGCVVVEVLLPALAAGGLGFAGGFARGARRPGMPPVRNSLRDRANPEAGALERAALDHDLKARALRADATNLRRTRP